MANLYVLEGENFNGKHSFQKPFNSPRRMRNVNGIVESNFSYDFMGGRSLWQKTKSVAKGTVKIAAMPITTTYTVAKSATKAATHAVLNPSLQNFSRIVTDPSKRLSNETVSNVRTVAHTGLEAGRGINTAASRTGKAVVYAANVTRRVAKRLIKSVARTVLFSGDSLLGESLSRIPKNAAKTLLIPSATAAVAANPTTAPATPIVPILVNEVVDELYSVIERNIKRGLSPKQAAESALKDMDKLEPGEETDPGQGVTPMLLLGLAAAIVGAVIIFKRKRK